MAKAVIKNYVEKNINVDRVKDILNKRINEHMEKITNFTMIFCWKVKSDEYSITIIKGEAPCSPALGSNQESLERVVKRVFNRINIDNFEDFAVVFVSSPNFMV